MAALRAAALAAAAMAALLPAPAALAQKYPDKPVHVIVPFPPGAGVDIVTRLVGAKLTTQTGQQFIMENKGGAAGNLGAEYVARATPDGYTILAAASSITASKSLYQNLTYDLEKDFVPVAMMASVPFLLVVNPKVPVHSVQELIAYAKAHPGQLTFASTGNGSSPHLTTELFETQAGVKMLHVPYKGSGPALTDLISGQVQVMFANMLSVLPAVKAGRLRALAVTSSARSSAAPDVPTVAESGVPGFESSTWFALMAPTGTPPAVIQQLNAETAKAVQAPQVVEALHQQGAEPGQGTPAQVAAYVKGEIHKWNDVVQQSGAKIE
jgi:tripartite-type tricarboxylate transporter receptor subunit TctC